MLRLRCRPICDTKSRVSRSVVYRLSSRVSCLQAGTRYRSFAHLYIRICKVHLYEGRWDAV